MNEKLDSIRFSRPSDFADFAEKKQRILCSSLVRSGTHAVASQIARNLQQGDGGGLFLDGTRSVGKSVLKQQQKSSQKRHGKGWGGWRRVALACFFSHL